VHREVETPVPLRAVIARNLRRLRQDAGVELEDVSRAASGTGLEWSLSWLSSLERGTRSPSAEQLLALPVVLSTALGFRVTLADLLTGDAPVLLGPDTGARVSVPAKHLRALVTGEPMRRPFAAPALAGGDLAAELGEAARAAEKMREIRRAGLGDVDVRALSRAEAGAGDAETKLAKKLSVAPIRVIAAAASLWGRSLTEERAGRVAAGQGSAAQVTKKLTGELTARMDEALRHAPTELAPVSPAPVHPAPVHPAPVHPAPEQPGPVQQPPAPVQAAPLER
jgi:transcriptional regulator with XRE-family HTH domain